MVGVGILAVIGLDPVIAGGGQHRLHLVQGLLQLRAGHHPGLFVAAARAGKVAAVMGQANGIAGQVFPGPVQAGQLAVMGVLGRDVLAGIIPGIPGNALFAGGPHLHRQIHRVGGHPVGFVGRHYNAEVHPSTFCTMFRALSITLSMS